MVWCGFIGSAFSTRERARAVDYFRNLFPKKWATAVTFVLDLLTGFLILLIIIYGYQLNLMQMMTTQVGTGIRGVLLFFAPPREHDLHVIYNSISCWKGSFSGRKQKQRNLNGLQRRTKPWS